MPNITFITRDNKTITVQGNTGSVMELAKRNQIRGIAGDCGGVCSCATCHVQVIPEHFDKVGPAGEIEKEMLELEEHLSDFSRLCCQIEISEALDGLVLQVVNQE